MLVFWQVTYSILLSRNYRSCKLGFVYGDSSIMSFENSLK